MSDKYAEVAPALPLKASGTQVYTYKVPAQSEEILKEFSAVTIPFGKRFVSGVVTKLHSNRISYPTKLVSKVTDTALTGKQMQFAEWISKTMQGGLGYTLRLFQPPGKTTKKDAVFSSPEKVLVHDDAVKALSKKSAVLIDHDVSSRNDVIAGLIYYNSMQEKQVLTVVPEKTMLDGPGVSYSADMPKKEATTIWHEVRKGNISAVRGTQKTLYLPFKKLGLIVVEEEQYSTHKLWDQYPKFHNKDAVKALAKIHGCPVLYVAAHPSLDTYHGIKTGQLEVVRNKAIMPHASMVTLSFDDKMKKYIIPHGLVMKIKKWAANNEKVLIFYDRIDNKRLKYILRANLNDSSYGNCTISTSKIFAQGSYGKFDRVVWLFPERSLSFPDFRSVEKSLITFTRLHQISTDVRRNIFIVTKEESTIDEILKPLSEVYDRELRVRQPLGLPPYQSQVKLRVSATVASKAKRKSLDVVKEIRERMSSGDSSGVIMRGPYQNYANKKQWFVLLRGPQETLIDLYGGLGVDYADLSPATIF